jgi:hypothetical protein
MLFSVFWIFALLNLNKDVVEAISKQDLIEKASENITIKKPPLGDCEGSMSMLLFVLWLGIYDTLRALQYFQKEI